ncbi:MAG: NAD(P)H-quinone oxidoreductase [Firmicutes bacterium]|nr:NAD(P)H-quinone oxidoreductase [Bacillota bacterium]
MRAIVLEQYGGPEVLTMRDIPKPRTGPDEVLIRVHATALNRADLVQRQGRYPPPGKMGAYQVPGLEASGEVEAVGERVTLFQPGDRVMALLAEGGYAEYVAAHERLTMPIPENMSWEEASAIPEVFLTAFDALYNQGEARPGDAVLVHAGASGVGSAAIQLAHEGGMLVIATVGSQLKEEAARAFGADVVVNYRQEPFLPVVQRVTQNRGVDVILDFVGQQYLEANIEALAPDGTLVVIGTLSGSEGRLNLGLVLGRRLRIQGTALRSRPIERKMALVQQFLREAWPLLANGRVKPVIDRVYSLDKVADAHRYMASNQNIGKIVMAVSPATSSV